MKYVNKSFQIAVGGSKVSQAEWDRIFKPKPKKSRKKSCPKCKHSSHAFNDCKERVTDAAGDVDWCPCQYPNTLIL